MTDQIKWHGTTIVSVRKGGKVVKNPKQAIAIALSQAGKAKKK